MRFLGKELWRESVGVFILVDLKWSRGMDRRRGHFEERGDVSFGQEKRIKIGGDGVAVWES